MPRRLLLALLILVAAPLALLGWVSASTYREQQQAARARFQRVYQTRLSEIDQSLGEVLDEYARYFSGAVTQKGNTIDNLRMLGRDHPVVRTCMYVNGRGLLVYPPRPISGQEDEFALYAALPAIVSSKPDFSKTGKELLVLGDVVPSAKAAHATFEENKSPRSSADEHWQVWYMDEGIQLIYWVPHDNGAASGILLERARWVSDLTAALPDSPQRTRQNSVADQAGSSVQASGFTAISDESLQIVYRWGDDGEAVDPPLATLGLAWPLASWRLEYHGIDPIPAMPTASLLASLTGVGVVLLALGAYVLTGVQRQMRTARSRVTFASQVSHELRTPLTNIRLYAELAESDLQQLPAGASRESLEKRLRVIDTESRRLGRLVSGVLEMIRDNRRQQQPRIRWAIPDGVIEQVLTQFAPSLENAEIDISRDLHANRSIGFDPDILEMILVNLLSNVEKYAANGKRVMVHSSIEGRWITVRVSDKGPGIAKRYRSKVFRPFARLDDSIASPSGTGIGLTIARRLASRHGGELKLIEGGDGASFEFRLATKPRPGSEPTGPEPTRAGESRNEERPES